MISLISRAFNYLIDTLPINHHLSLINFSTALGHHNLKEGICMGVERMGIQAVCSGEMIPFNERVRRISRLWIKNFGSYPRVVSGLRRELSEGIIEKDISKIQSVVDLLAFADGIALAQNTDTYRCLIDEEKVVRHKDRMSKLQPLTYSQKIESLGGLETIGIAIDMHSVETFKEYILEIKTIAERASIEFLILQLGAEGHAITIIYSPNEQSWYCIDANDLPIKKELSDQKVSNWVFRAYNSLYSTDKKSLLISSNVKVLGNNLQQSKAFESWRAIQQANRLTNLAPEAINTKNKSNLTPLQEVAKLDRLPGMSNAEVLGSLLDRGADPSNIDMHGNTALMDVVTRDDVKAAKVLLDHGADPNIKSIDEWTPLSHAARVDDIEMVKTLLKAGADVNIKGKDDWTPLMHAVRHGDANMVKALLKAGADANIKNKEAWTPLLLAARYGDANRVKALLKAGADANIKNKGGWTPHLLAVRYGDANMVKALLKAGADPI